MHTWVSFLVDCVDSLDRAPSCLSVGKLTLDKVSNGIVWLDEIQQFYRERSAIEKEYSAKLYALAKKYFDKKAKRSANLSVGDTPSLTPGSLERFSLGAAQLWFRHADGRMQRLSDDMDHTALNS